ncbi:MAG TPA: spermidine/putrescine ABC transporter ATP-binding protein, partial [Clostridiales bacterium]|nr:spermidine/putrescine ABC transporter ATP-binding protein [Clostridiales bacterium]
MKEVLRFERVEMRYHTKTSETVAVKDLSFSVSEGEFLAVVGPSGCGKTTLLSLAAGLLKPSSGKVISSGVTFGYMLQKDELFPWRTIE